MATYIFYWWYCKTSTSEYSKKNQNGIKDMGPSQAIVINNPARMYLQLPLQQWSAGNVYFFVLSSWTVNIAKNPIVVMGL